ncbi:hypothetical protein DGWBC_0453 [Dehalogenimonas sp. WBC-2]|nr:hypothetical protein DGWBC_0453 [Dehalogenimonas sp. WBC-2]
MKPLVKSVNWLDLALISFAVFVIVFVGLGVFEGFGSYPTLTAYLFFMVIITAIAFLLKLVGIIGKIGVDERMKTVNWINFGLAFLAYSLIINSAQVGFGDHSSGYWSFIRYSLAVMVAIGTALYFYRSTRSKRVATDERTREITNRSARNALGATWFGLLLVIGSPIHGSAERSHTSADSLLQAWGNGMITATMDQAVKVLIVIGVAALVFVISLYIYQKQSPIE